MSETIYFRGSAAEAYDLIGKLAYILAGTEPDVYNLAPAVQLRVGVALLSEVQRDFITKSRGGVGRDGIKWPDLSPKTKAYGRRTTRTERKQLGIGKGSRPTLNAAQDQRWRSLFSYHFRIGLGDLPRREARRRAAAIAWDILKREGAKTKLELLGSRQVDIMRDTGLLFKSLSPGVDDRPSEADGQVFRLLPGKVVVGTNQKPWHHRGDPSKNLPARSLWPLDGSIPEQWRAGINRAAARGVKRVITAILAGVPA